MKKFTFITILVLLSSCTCPIELIPENKEGDELDEKKTLFMLRDIISQCIDLNWLTHFIEQNLLFFDLESMNFF